MVNVILIALIAVALIFGARSYAKKLRHGCCGGESGEAVKRVRVRDRDPRHYPHAARLSIEGMTCTNCQRRVENALCGIDGVWARVDLSQGAALARMKTPVPLEDLASAVRQAGYTVTKAEALR